MKVCCKVHQAGISNKVLFVRAVRLGRIDHRLDIFRLGFVEESSVAYNETTIFASNVDEILDVVFNLLGSSQTQRGGGHIAEKTGILAQGAFNLGHI